MFCRLALFLVSVSLFAQVPFTQFVVFGDSLSDNGNLLVGITVLGESQRAGSTNVRDGRIYGWHQLGSLHQRASGPLDRAARDEDELARAPTVCERKGGTNYAVAGALTGINPGLFAGDA